MTTKAPLVTRLLVFSLVLPSLSIAPSSWHEGKPLLRDSILVETDRYSARMTHLHSPTNPALIVVLIPPGKMKARVVGVSPENPGGFSSKIALQEFGAEVVLGSGFWESYYPLTPVGLLLIDRVTVNPVRSRGLPTIITVLKGRVSLVSKQAFKPQGVDGALQVGPELVRDGKVVDRQRLQRNGFFTRAFLGLRKDGTCIVGKTLDIVNLEDLAHFLSRSQADGGLECEQGVNLSGGGSDVLSFKCGSKTLSYGSDFSNQSALIVFR